MVPIMEDVEWIKSQAAAKQPLNLHAVARNRPALLKAAYSGRSPRGWHRTLVEAGVNPYKIVHEHSEEVPCSLCEYSGSVLGSHLKIHHGIERDEYCDECGPNFEVSSESFRVGKFKARPIHGIRHWERLWSGYYVIDWILRLRDEGHALNYHTINQQGQPLTYAGIKFFGSWDAALLAAGLRPEEIRAIAVFQQWSSESVILALREFAEEKKSNWRLNMPMDLRCAITRVFGNPGAGAKAAGLKHEDISHRAIFSSPKVVRLVEAIRKLEGIKGQARVVKLRAIYHKDADSRRIVQNSYGSLRKLAVREGIDLRAVSPSAYRDKVDVLHELDLIERSGKPINHKTLKRGYKRLYNVISETGWGRERLDSFRCRSFP